MRSVWTVLMLSRATIAAVCLLLAAVFWLGMSHDNANDAQNRADTLERALNADTLNPNGSDDLEWLYERGGP